MGELTVEQIREVVARGHGTGSGAPFRWMSILLAEIDRLNGRSVGDTMTEPTEQMLHLGRLAFARYVEALREERIRTHGKALKVPYVRFDDLPESNRIAWANAAKDAFNMGVNAAKDAFNMGVNATKLSSGQS